MAVAIVPPIIGHTFCNWALKYLPTTFVSVALFGEPIGTTILVYFILNEFPSTF
ncbi:MAG: EamA family transporter [Anaerolineales bacterium]